MIYTKKYYSLNPHVTPDPTSNTSQKLRSDGSTPKFELNLNVIPEHSFTRGTHYKIKKYFRENYVLGENGYYYTGQLKNGVKHGWGVDFWADNCRFYQGEYYDGQRSGIVLNHNIFLGSGKFYWRSGQTMYEGYVRNGLWHGHGISYLVNGLRGKCGVWCNGSLVVRKDGLIVKSSNDVRVKFEDLDMMSIEPISENQEETEPENAESPENLQE
jgi:hypothetical protein